MSFVMTLEGSELGDQSVSVVARRQWVNRPVPSDGDGRGHSVIDVGEPFVNSLISGFEGRVFL